MSIDQYFKKVKVEEREDVRELRTIDTNSRKEFLSIDLTKPVVVGLQACPGAGKTTIVLDLIKRNTELRFVLLYYNKDMVTDALKRVKEAELTNVDVFTLDKIARSSQPGLTGAPFENRDKCFKEAFGKLGALRTWNTFTRIGDELPGVDTAKIKVLDKPFAVSKAVPKVDHRPPTCDKAKLNVTGNKAKVEIADIKNWVRHSVRTGKWWDFATCCKLMQVDNMWPSALANYDVVIVDECQDMKPSVVAGMAKMHGIKPVLYVGDSDQSLYAFDGTVDAFETLRAAFSHNFVFPGTYRFGQDVCDLINQHGFASQQIIIINLMKLRSCALRKSQLILRVA